MARIGVIMARYRVSKTYERIGSEGILRASKGEIKRKNKKRKRLLKEKIDRCRIKMNVKRIKEDSLVIRQHEIYTKLVKAFPDLVIQKDIKKSNYWFDFCVQSHRIIIKILSDKLKGKLKDKVQNLGYHVLCIRFNDIADRDINYAINEIRRIINKNEFVQNRAYELNSDLPKSEQWFLEKIKKELIYDKMYFKQNVPLFGKYIYDLFSKYYRVAIEVDGSYHDRDDQRLKDEQKDQFTVAKGFTIIRVRAYDEDSYNRCVQHLILIANRSKKTMDDVDAFGEKIREQEKSGKLGF